MKVPFERRAFSILIALAILAFAYEMTGNTDAIIDTYGFSGNNTLERPYVIVTSVFLHGSLTHLLSNILIWLFFGMAVESELGRLRMLAVFLLGAIAGEALSLLIYPFDSISIGASAGIFALMGAGMLVKPLDLSFYPLIVPIPLALLGMFYAVYNAYEFVFLPDSSISYIGHFGGLAVGLYFGFREKGFKHGMKIILATIAVMILVPLIFLFLAGKLGLKP